MKMYKKIIALAVMLIGMTGWARDSAPFLLDTTDLLVETGGEVSFNYNSSWIGDDSSAEVVISADGTEIKRTTGEGDFTWEAAPGKHTLTYTTYIDGVAQEEVYTATVFKDWKYTVEDGNATIVETTQKSGSVTIPSEIDGLPVVGFVDGLFDGCTNLTQVVIPGNCVAKMSDIFPDSYDKLTSVTLTGDITEIPDGFFAGCAALESFIIPDSVTKIGANVFAGCASLENVEISESVTDIGTGAFSGCAAMADDDGYLVIRGVLYGYFGDDNCVTVPDGVAVIDPKAFYECDALTSVTIPLEILEGNGEQTPQVEKNNWIEGEGGVYQSNDINNSESTSMTLEVEGPLDFTFDWKVSSEDDCDELKWYLNGSQISVISGTGSGWQTVNYSIPKGTHTLRWEYSKDRSVSNGDDCGWVRFTELVSTSVTMARLFPDSYTAITNVVLIGDGERIPLRAFAGCASLQNVVIPDGVRTIGVRAFDGCGALSEITIPDGVYSIGANAFANCTNLAKVSMPLLLKGQIEAGDIFAGYSEDLEIFYRSAEITDVAAKQRFPWNGKVNITYNVTGNIAAGLPVWMKPVISVSVLDRTTGSNYVAQVSALSGDTGIEEGEHHIVWDLNAQNLQAKSEEMVFTVAYESKPRLYCVIDLSAGANALSYSILGLDDVPQGGWTDEYKTTKLVLRRIEPGSFKMNGAYDVTLTKPYYMGVFEVTQKQYELVTGNKPSNWSGDTLPVECVSWNTIRGNSSTHNWPTVKTVDSNSFVGRLQARTGLNFDLPTEAQWEYACRAGTTTTYYWGDSMDSAYAWYSGNSSSKTHIVGTKMPNAWGLYDMSGNLWEWCLDGYGSLSSGIDPEGSSSGSYRVLRRGSWYDHADYCTSSIRISYNSSYESPIEGFRIVRTLSNINGERSTEAVAGAERAGEILYFASAASTKIDSRIEPLVDSIDVSYNSGWIGGEESAEVVILDNGTEIKRTTGEGEFAWAPITPGKHTLTYTTYIDGVAQEEVYTATVFKDWKYTLENGKATIIETTQISGDVVIPSEIDGCPVVCLKEGLFAGSEGLTSVIVPDSVNKIGENVFKDCTNLKSITIRLAVEGAAENLPDNVPLTLILDNNDQRIPDRLRNCVQKVIFSDGITRIADDFFVDCNNLETIDIPQSVVAIGRNVFNFCSSLNIVTQNGFKLYQGWCLGYEGADNSTLKIPEGVLGIAPEAFKGMTSLTSVTFPDSLRFIGADAFAGCTQLAELALTDGIVEIADGAFRDCTWVQNVKMSSNLERIGAAAFANCAYLPNVVCADGLEEIGVGVFSNCWRMTSVSLPASLDSVGRDAFWNCKNLGGVTVPAHVQPLAEMFPAAYSALSSIIIAEGETELCEGAFEGCAGVTKIDIPEAITNIPARAFKNCTSFDRVVLPTGLLTIGDEAFAGCSKVGSLTLPESLTSIGARAFNGWALLDVVTIPDGVTFIGSGAFAGCTAVRQVRMPSNVATVSATFPDAYTEIVRVMIPNNSTGIIAGFLNGCTSITSFDIPLSVTEIGDNAFRGCKNLSGITLPNSLEKIGSYAFYGCTLINDLTIPFSVTSIGNNAFGSCAQIRSVVISGEAGTLSSLFPNAYQQIVSVMVLSGSEKLMNRIFAGCKSLKNVDIPTSVTEIGEGAFENCTALTSVGIPSGVTVLGKGAFRGCTTLSEITLPTGLSILEDEVFSLCSCLSTITVPESVVEIGNRVFYGCTALHSVKFVGDAPLTGVESYAGVSSSLITYVPYASMGWDGISTSIALPEFWPVGYENTIEWWDPIRFDVTFDWNCEAGEVDVIEQVVDTTYLLPDVDPTREGAAFAGWWTATDGGARITPASRVMLTTPHTLYAHWRMNTYSVAFDANGGIGAMEPMDLTVNKPAVLTACGFTRFDCDFAGWAIEPAGEVLYRDCAEVSNLTLENDATMTLYAVWTPRTWTEGDYLNQPGFTFTSEGDEPWVMDAEVSHDGIGSLRSGAIGASAEYPNRTYSTIKTTVVGEGTGSFWWKVHCEEMDSEYGDWFDYAVFTVDGVEIAKIAGDNDWTKVTYSVTGAGEHELAWTFTRDDYDLEDAEWLNAAWLDELVWSPKMVALKFDAGGASGDVPELILRQEGDTVLLPGVGTLVKGTDIFKGWSDGTTLYAPGSEYTFGSEDETLTAIWEEKVWTLAEAADAETLVMTTGGIADWTIDATSGYTNTMSVKSGSVTSGQESWIETKVKGAGILTFRWKVMGGVYRNQPFAYAKVEVDGVEISSEYLTDGWEEVVYEITGVEEHTIRWTYLRTSTRAADGDCAWIDAVVWTPASSSDITVDMGNGKSVVVPMEWIDKYDSIVTAAGGDKAAALQRTAANGRKVWECFMLGVDPTKADDDFKITRFWMEGGKPMFEFSHSTDGAGNSFLSRLKVKGKAKLSDGWSEVPTSGDSSFRFFTVEVVLP